MDFVFKILPTEIEDKIASEVSKMRQYKKNKDKVLQDINKFGQVLDYEMNDRNVDNEYKQYRFFTDYYWELLIEVLEDIDTLEYHFQTRDNFVGNNILFECEVRFYDFYEDKKNGKHYYHPDKKW